MNYEKIILASGIKDMVIGGGVLGLIMSYDFLLHRTSWSLGPYAWLGIIGSVCLIVIGYKQIEFVIQTRP